MSPAAATTMPDRPATDDLAPSLHRGTALLKAGRAAAARELAVSLTRARPDARDAWLLASHAEQALVRFDAMLASAGKASALDPDHVGARLRLMECQLYCGRFGSVLEGLERLERRAAGDPRLWCKLGELYSHGNRHAEARRCYERAVAVAPDNPDCLFALASALIAVGDLEQADDTLTRVIQLNPHDYDAYRNRSTLRRQTPERNHVDQIRSRLEAGVRRPAGEVQLCYALAKEYEDLGEDELAFSYLKRGADRRRLLLRYRVEGDLAVMDRIVRVFDRKLLAATGGGDPGPGPVFVIGLPRSGTTLVDRILSSHSRVQSLGEINDFAYALMHTVGRPGDKLELVEHAARIDFALLGRRYRAATAEYGSAGPMLIDKTPLNYLYVGLIHLALPNARIIHIRRQPMDSCYAMYRTLFRAGYPFSYDLDDLGRYCIGYRALMDHWRELLPHALLDLQYEELVDDQERISRAIVDYCGLEWEPACLEFHRNAAPVATASAAQVRRPVYRDAIGRWRRYETQLTPLSDRLRAAGIDLER